MVFHCSLLFSIWEQFERGHIRDATVQFIYLCSQSPWMCKYVIRFHAKKKIDLLNWSSCKYLTAHSSACHTSNAHILFWILFARFGNAMLSICCYFGYLCFSAYFWMRSSPFWNIYYLSTLILSGSRFGHSYLDFHFQCNSIQKWSTPNIVVFGGIL